jgi:3-vinyl bacteriochlorophyllide hydratase
MYDQPINANRRKPLYTAEQRARRDASRWTLVQAVLAPMQFFVFAVSLFMVVRYLMTGQGLDIATASIVLKTFVLYAIMITGAIWEKDVFGKYLFADAFFWEDAVSMIVIALHTAYLVMLLGNIGSPVAQITVALAGYAAYVINAVQFVWKLRLARLSAGSLEATA